MKVPSWRKQPRPIVTMGDQGNSICQDNISAVSTNRDSLIELFVRWGFATSGALCCLVVTKGFFLIRGIRQTGACV